MAAQQYAQALADPAKAPFRAVEAAADFYRRQNKMDKLEALKKSYLDAHPAISTLMEDGTANTLSTLIDERALGESSGAKLLVETPQEGFAEVLFTMASVLYSVEAASDAELYLRMAIYLRPDFALAQLMLGSALESDGRFAEAGQIYGSVSPKSPFYERSLLRKAYMLERENKLDQALSLLSSRAQSAPQDYTLYVAKGDLLRMHNRFPEAIEAYGQAIKRIGAPREQHWAVFFARGSSYERNGNWERAEADLRTAMKLSPEQAEVLNYLGYSILIRGGDVQEAKQLIEQAYALQPDAPEIMDSLGWVLYKTGDANGAVKYLEQAVQAMPSDASINDHLGDAYLLAGRKNEALFQWQRALSYQPEATLEKAIQKKLHDGAGKD